MKPDAMADLCACGVFTGLALLLFPSGSTGAAGHRAVSVCCLVEALRLLALAIQGGVGR